jgi:hypothetical protein
MFLYLFPFILWFINLEANPSMRGIWLRPNELGKIKFVLKNAITLLIEPFKNSLMWNIKLWDINIVTFYFCCFLFYMFFENIYNLCMSNNLTDWNKFYMKIMHL